MKIIQIPAVKQLVNISIMLIQALSKTCWRFFKEFSQQLALFAALTKVQLYPKSFRGCCSLVCCHLGLNMTSSTQLLITIFPQLRLFVIFGTKNHCQNQRVHQSRVPQKHLFIEKSSWQSFTHHQKNLSIFLSLPFSTQFKASSIPYLTTESLKQATNNMV